MKLPKKIDLIKLYVIKEKMRNSDTQLVNIVRQLTEKVDELEKRLYTESRNNQYLYTKLRELENKMAMSPVNSQFQVVKPNVTPYFNPNSIW